jgi:hypothetical protein
VTEDFCGFVELVKTNAETISTYILNKLRQWGFDLTRLRGQGYDGCSTMSGEMSGVKNTQKNVAPPSARRNFFKCAPPSNLKSWIRPCNASG